MSERTYESRIMDDDIQKHSVHTLIFRSIKRSHDMFICNHGKLPSRDKNLEMFKKEIKKKDTYGPIVKRMKQMNILPHRTNTRKQDDDDDMSIQGDDDDERMDINTSDADDDIKNNGNNDINDNNRIDNQLVPLQNPPKYDEVYGSQAVALPSKPVPISKPRWHAPWKLYRVLSGHLGWVRCIAIEPGNEWFATGSADRIIKIWDLATGKLKVSLTGHVSSVRGLAVSNRHPYIFSCGEDKQVKCWDLEYNKVIRHYHGHLSAIYTLSLHPGLDVLITGGRDATARVWDVRTKANVHTLSGHTNTVASVISQIAEPQVISASHDCTIRLWDLAAGKTMAALTHHRKSVRSVIFHPTLYMFASASPDNIKQWKCPTGIFVQNLFGHNAIINCLAVNQDGVLISGADNGSIYCWDWLTGHNFQRIQAPVQPGSMDSESGIFAATFDQSGTRLLVCEADKTIKIYREDETATEETHPVYWRANLMNVRKY